LFTQDAWSLQGTHHQSDQAVPSAHIKKSNNAGIFVQCSTLNWKEAWSYYFAIYLPSIGYLLFPTVTLKQPPAHYQSQGDETHLYKMWFQPKYQQSSSLCTFMIRRRTISTFVHEKGIGQIQIFKNY
jgi:hypothetical protein